MDSNWVKVHSFSQRYMAEIAKGVLAENEITTVILDKKDSAYMFGEVELYASQDNAMKASHLIKKHNL